MKYALINENGLVGDLLEQSPEFLSDGQSTVQLTDEQVEQVQSGNRIMFYVDGELITRRAKRWAEDPEGVKDLYRLERNRLLAESDWTQLSDSPLSEDILAAWSVYRQDLRDLTDEIDENGEVDFPEKP